MMKKLFLLTFSTALFFSSCTNDENVIELDNKICEVNLNVSLKNFFSSYDFNDTQHNINVSEDYRTFYSESKKFIQVRTLFYNSKGVLTDSLMSFVKNLNEFTATVHLAPGKYTAISTLVFSDKSSEDETYWCLKDKNNLSTVVLEPVYRTSKWAIMSYDSKVFSVDADQNYTLAMNPKPVGALAYMFMQNFCYKNEASYPTKGDNSVRAIAVYAREIADGYRLDPNASEKYIYRQDAGKNSWWFLSDNNEPQDFENSKSYGYFRTNLYSYFYILAPTTRLVFGYVLAGASYFQAYGEATYDIQSGKTYLAYWDWFKVGNPYFGIADNNHWNTYSSDTREMDWVKW